MTFPTGIMIHFKRTALQTERILTDDQLSDGTLQLTQTAIDCSLEVLALRSCPCGVSTQRIRTNGLDSLFWHAT